MENQTKNEKIKKEFGEAFSRLTELVSNSFAVYHTQRHLRQLEKTAEKVK